MLSLLGTVGVRSGRALESFGRAGKRSVLWTKDAVIREVEEQDRGGRKTREDKGKRYEQEGDKSYWKGL